MIRVGQYAAGSHTPRLPGARSAQTLQQECLDQFIVFGERHLRYLIQDSVRYYHDHRPHQSLGNLPPSMDKPPDEVAVLGPADVVRTFALRAANCGAIPMDADRRHDSRRHRVA